MAERRQTALGVARARFVEGLPRKAREVRASLALLAGTPDEERPREELRRRLHALYASAQVFRIGPLAAALKDSLADIDRVREQHRGFDQDELDSLANLAATLPALGLAGEGAAATSETPSVPGLEGAATGDGEEREEPARGRAEGAHSPRPAPRAASMSDSVISVLVLDDPVWQARARAALPAELFELMMADNAEDALRLARSSSPDVVLADRKILIGGGADLIERLREDPLTDFVPVVLLLAPGSRLDPIAIRALGADEALVKPFDGETLAKTLRRVTDTLSGPAGASTLTGDLTVQEIAERIADEVKRGLVEAAGQGKDVSIPMGDGTPLLAAAWSAIGRVRAHVAERSGGRVRFREGPQRGGPAFVTMVDEGSDAESDNIVVDLAGRRALVVDDDPAVVWFFAGLLREHGADVAEAGDGFEALKMARSRRPDLIISDILMPQLDGFGLTRALKRDPLLADVPVILLSWKEDFLQRMRQLRAGASGYLRKEAGSAQILTAVRDVLRPRARLESRLRTGGDVRGRLEAVGVQTLVMTVAQLRPDARLTLRDAASLFEVDLREGELLDVTRTASDGGFTRGDRALRALLGTTTGRFTVADATAPVRRSRSHSPKGGSLDDVMQHEMTELAARVDAVTGRNLAKAEKLVLDEDILDAVLRGSPDEVDRVVSALRSGRGPRALLVSGDVEPHMLEDVLVDLARQGAIQQVVGPDGEDRIALAREARKRERPELPEEAHDPLDVESLSWLSTGDTTQEILLEAHRLAAEPYEDPLDEELESLRPPPLRGDTRPRRPLEELEPPSVDDARKPRRTRSSDRIAETLDEPFAEVDARSSRELDDAITLERSLDLDDPTSDERALEATTPGRLPAPDLDDDEPELAFGADDSDDEDSDDDDEDEDSDDDDEDTDDDEDEDSDDQDDDADTEEDTAGHRDDDQPVAEGALAASAAPSPSDGEPSQLPSQPSTTTPAQDRPAVAAAVPPPAERRLGWMAWALLLLGLAAIGFVGLRLLRDPPPPDSIPGPIATEEHDDGAPTDPGRLDEPPTGVAQDPADGPDATDRPAPSAAELPVPYGREEDGIRDIADVTVAPGQGLLVLSPSPGAASMTVQLGDRQLRVGSEPLGVAVDPGVHHLTYVRGDSQDFVWVAVRAGKTRYVPPLP